jgi:hypothetical protein
MTDTANKTRITQVGTVFVPVADQDRALEFYLYKLGFEKRADFPYGEGSRWRGVDVDANVARKGKRRSGLVSLEVSIGDPVPPQFFFRDIDGNRFLIVESR